MRVLGNPRCVLSCCLAAVVVFMLLALAQGSPASADRFPYKRSWRPQGRFGKRTILPAPSDEDYSRLLESKTENNAYLLDSAAEAMLESGEDRRPALVPQSKPILWARDAVCVHRGHPGDYKCYRWSPHDVDEM